MRNIPYRFLLAATLLTLMSCDTCLPAQGTNGDDTTQPLSITVTDKDGYVAADDSRSRALEENYRTVFTAGDACGIFVVRGNEVIVYNMKLTASGDKDYMEWIPERQLHYSHDDRYFIYYPYQDTFEWNINKTADNDDAFFEDLIQRWKPKADQGDYKGYTASDLMTDVAEVDNTPDGKHLLNFAMAHRMALAVIELPATEYEYSNVDGLQPFIDIPEIIFIGDGKACVGSGATRHRILRPGEKAAGHYRDGESGFSITAPDAGNYTRYIIDGGLSQNKRKTWKLQAEDHYCVREESGRRIGYAIPQAAASDFAGLECIGMVISVGHHATDISRYDNTGIDSEQCHGYAIALRYVEGSSGCMWGTPGIELECYPKDSQGNPQNNFEEYASPLPADWSGYYYTEKIIEAAGGRANLKADEATGYPAAYYAVVKFERDTPAPVNSSGWFLPTISQLHESLQGWYLETIGSVMESQYYWSSSEYYADPRQALNYLSPGPITARICYHKDKDYVGEYSGRETLVSSILAF